MVDFFNQQKFKMYTYQLKCFHARCTDIWVVRRVTFYLHHSIVLDGYLTNLLDQNWAISECLSILNQLKLCLPKTPK